MLMEECVLLKQSASVNELHEAVDRDPEVEFSLI